MNTRNPVYIAAPFRGSVEENVRRAYFLSLLAVREGFAPIVVHPGIHQGAYGDDTSPEARQRGREVSLSLLHLVACHPYGELWVLLNDDGSESEGVHAECVYYKRCRDKAGVYNCATARTWADWQRRRT